MSRKQLFFVILTFFPLFLMAETNTTGKKITCVVIDAGHGGHDPGAIGFTKAKEKDIALSIALKLGKLIQKNNPEIKVIYTRKTDVFVELHKRAAIANSNKADLFISIHCNSSKKSEPFGVETWVMGLHKSAANLEVAKKENASILMEKDHVVKYDGFNPNSAEAYIIFSLFQNMYISQSLSLANSIESNFKSNLKLFDRGVKQAGFLVLYKTSMPSVLVEAGFVSNPKDELYLKKENGQESIAYSLYKAFLNYKSSIEGTSIIAQPNSQLLTYDQVKDPRDTMTIKSSPNQANDTNRINITPLTDKFLNSPHPIKNNRTKTKKDSSHVNITPLTDKYIDANPRLTPKIISNPKTKIDSNAIYTKPKGQTEQSTGSKIVFRVQFASSPTAKNLINKEFQNLENVYEYKQGNTFKYTAGAFSSIKEAIVYQTKLQSIGYIDCFVIAFNNDIRISPTEATKLLNSQSN